MTKLLSRPLKAFALYALVILAISIPVYALVVDYIWVTELDENNWLTLQHTKQKLKSNPFSEEEIEQINHIWGELQPGVSMVKTARETIPKDSVYEIVRKNAFSAKDDDDEDRFRVLKSYINLHGHVYEITVETNIEEVDETLLAVALVTFVFFLILIIGFLILNRKIAANSWKPFYKTLHNLQTFDLSKADHFTTTPTDIQEFQALNQSLEQLVQNNIEAYQLQKSFTENASHELQTPIAVLKSKLDLLLQEPNVSPEINAILSSIEAPLSRLSRINKNLLLLAKVENQQYAEKEQLDVKTHLHSALSLFEDYLNTKNISCTNLIDECFMIEANPFLLETLLHNLLSNAIRHTATNGQIIITHENRTIAFSNTGDKALNAQHLFERFSSVTNAKVSSGLGLAIIKEISTKNNWQINYHFESGFHIFRIGF